MTGSPSGDARPRTEVRAGQRRDLERALRPDDDLGQREPLSGNAANSSV